MKQKKIISLIVGIVILASIGAGIYFSYPKKSSDEIKSRWITSGPFSIDKSQYKLGESVFLVVAGLKPDESGNIIIIRPNGDTYTTIPFNGTLKNGFNYYFKPDTEVARDIYNPSELVGSWKIIFQGVEYKALSFEVINEYIRGAEKDIISIPKSENNSTG